MKKKRGSTLILVLLVASVLMILGTSLLAVTSSTYALENSVDNTNKLIDMAESGMEIAMAQVENVNSSTSPAAFTDISGLKSDDGTITCNVKFYKDQEYNNATKTYINASGKYTIESIASNSKGSKTIRAIISNSATSVPTGIIPTNNLFYINSSVQSGNFAVGEADGDIYTNGDFNMASGSTIKGRLISNGNITLSGGTSSNNGIISFGNVNLDGGGTVNGDALIKGDLNFGGGTAINGNVKCDGNLNMPQGTIQKDATIAKNASFSGGAPKISGTLYYQGSVSTGWGTVNNFVSGGAVKTASYTPIDLSSYIPPVLPVVSVPTSAQNPQMYNDINLNTNTYTINSSGHLTSNTFNSVANWGQTITIDTSSKDISLLVNTNFSTGKQLTLEVTGPHNLYIYLTGNSSFTIDNQYIRMQNHSAASSNIYIIGDGSQSVILNSCELDANIYIPNGSLSASGGAKNYYIFQGSCVTKSVNISSNVNANYLTPNVSGTPLAVLNNLQYNSGSGTSSTTNNWGIDNWYN